VATAAIVAHSRLGNVWRLAEANAVRYLPGRRKTPNTPYIDFSKN
jgi:hypothetical protein